MARRIDAAIGSSASSAVTAVRSRRTWPSLHTNSMSTPAGSFASALWSQVPHGSDHPSTRKVQDPSASKRTQASHGSSPRGSSGVMSTRVWLPSGSVRITDAFTASCPSRNTFARMGTNSPSAALAAWAPPKMTGSTLVTGMRPIPPCTWVMGLRLGLAMVTPECLGELAVLAAGCSASPGVWIPVGECSLTPWRQPTAKGSVAGPHLEAEMFGRPRSDARGRFATVHWSTTTVRPGMVNVYPGAMARTAKSPSSPVWATNR